MSQVLTANPVAPAGGRPCPSCGRERGAGVACQFCEQVEGLASGVRLATVGRRFGGYLLEILLFLVTLAIGWIVWSLIIWDRGQTPSKQLLGMRCISLSDSRRASWGRMFVREFVAKGLVMTLISIVTFGLGPLILAFMLMWTTKRQELWDKIADTIVVHEASIAAARHKQMTVAVPRLARPPLFSRRSERAARDLAQARAAASNKVWGEALDKLDGAMLSAWNDLDAETMREVIAAADELSAQVSPRLARVATRISTTASGYLDRITPPTQAAAEAAVATTEAAGDDEVAAAAESFEKTCPDCAETIKSAANVCRYCGYRFGPAG